MYKFDTTTITGSYIKQLLHDFNLPICHIYTREQANYAARVTKKINELLIELQKLNTIQKRYVGELSSEDIKNKNDNEHRINEIEAALEYYRAHRELNVIKTIYRNEQDDYKMSQRPSNQLTNYPRIMTYVPYIKDGIYQEYDGTKWIECHAAIDLNSTTDVNHQKVHDPIGNYYTVKRYLYNKRELNYTRNLKIDNNIYDTYTHEYLGDYLRFQRDYNGLDLMPLYNCFSNNICTNLNIDLTDPSNKIINGVFNSKDESYKIYVVPVKLFAKYTIAIECASYIEVFCGLYDSYLDKRSKFNSLYKKTYAYYNSLQFNSPIVYDKLVDIPNLLDDDDGSKLAELGQNEKNLKLFIKIPASVQSSIVILEGDYTNWQHGNLDFNQKTKQWERKTNHAIYNYEYKDINTDFQYITPLQLLKINTGESYPFSTKLIDYLVGHAITHLDENPDNIERVKTVISKNITDIIPDNLWTDEIRPILYEYMIDNKNTEDLNTEIFGYVDTVTEKNYSTDYISRLQAAINTYNSLQDPQTNYGLYNLSKLLEVNNAIEDLIKIDPKLVVLKKYKSNIKDISIAGVDIYENGGKTYGRR